MEWFEDEDFWRELYTFMFPPERFAAADQQADQILTLAQPAGKSMLDLCCGPGRHSIAFARRGFQVTAVDRSPLLLTRARKHSADAGMKCEWILSDMRVFVRPDAFDLACNLFTSFGYFEDEADNIRVLRNVLVSLKPGGVFVMEMIGKEWLARNWQSILWSELEGGAKLVQRPQVRNDWTRVRNEWLLLKDGGYRTFEFEHAIYSGRELKDRLLAVGFAEVRLFGDLAGAEYGRDATRLVAVARKASVELT